jgi:hypothetical protein
MYPFHQHIGGDEGYESRRRYNGGGIITYPYFDSGLPREPAGNPFDQTELTKLL